MRCVPALLLVLALARSVGAEPAPLPWSKLGGPRVRPADDRATMLLLDGMRRSSSLARLVERIETGDVIVYIEMQRSLRSTLAGCVTWMGRVNGYRYVRTSLNPELTTDTLIAAVGHELQHVVEVIDNPSVTDAESLQALYRRIGSGGARAVHLDTQDAKAAGALVREDLRRAKATGAIPGSGPMSPLRWHTWYRQRPAAEARR